MPDPKGLAAAAEGNGTVTSPPCPQCKGPTIRVARRQVDRLSTWMVSARRYRCQSFQCQWEGNVRLKSAGIAPVAAQQWADEGAPGSVSRVFLLSMALALAGLTYILVSTYTDWLEPGGFLVSVTSVPVPLSTSL
ncbi:MAG: hypothetical protein KA164_04675 [Rhodoferax sp.]|jgi:hypothetical protein|nr:hypothetical protein [Rhodoferax sp.]